MGNLLSHFLDRLLITESPETLSKCKGLEKHANIEQRIRRGIFASTSKKTYGDSSVAAVDSSSNFFDFNRSKRICTSEINRHCEVWKSIDIKSCYTERQAGSVPNLLQVSIPQHPPLLAHHRGAS